MKMERWAEVEAILDAALDSDPSGWPALLDQRCTDPELRRDVESLLRHHSRARRFLSSPPVGTAAAVLDEARASASLEGMRIGAYRIVRQVGQGGTARVYLAERDDGQFRQRVALKLLRPGHDSEIDRGRFRAERQILASLSHPNIARLLDGGITDDGLPYLAMELIEGEPIDRYCETRALRVRDRLRMFLTVCEATRYAHRNLVVHRDLKPSNILVTADGQVKLLDFGLAKLLEREQPPASDVTSRHWMTPAYAAPEQVRGDAATTLTDVYQLGVVLYELLTGALPFPKRDSSYELAQTILDGEPPSPSSVKPGEKALRGDLDAIVLMALRKEPDKRYASVDALREDLERYLAGLPVHARQGNAAYRARRYARRHRFAVAAAAAFVFVLVGYAVTLSVHAQRVRATLARVEEEKAKAEVSARFLTGLFSPAGAGFGPRDTLSARQLIARGERNVEELGAEPLAQAQLLTVLGSILRTMREHQHADSLLTRALELRRSALGEHHADVAETAFQLAMVARQRGENDRARGLLTRALEVRRALLGALHPGTVETGLQLALLSNNVDTVMASQRQVLALARRTHGDEHGSVADAMLQLGITLRNKGALEESENVLRTSLAMRRRIEPPDHRMIGAHLGQLAITLKHRGRLDESEQLHRALLLENEARHGADHPLTAGALRMLTEVLLLRGKTEEAERYARRDLAMRLRSFGANHVEYGMSAGFLSDVLRQQGAFDEAEDLERQHLATYQSTFGPDHVNISGSLAGLGLLLLERGRIAEAEPLLLRAFAIRVRHSGADSPFAVYLTPGLARLAREKGNLAAADSLLAHAFTVLRSAGMLDSQDNMQHLHRESVRLYDAWGKPELADRHRALLIRQ